MGNDIKFKHLLISFVIGVLTLVIALAINSLSRSMINQYAPNDKIKSHFLYVISMILTTFVILYILHRIYPKELAFSF